MRTLKLSTFSKANVWLGELPTFAYHVNHTALQEITVSPMGSRQASQAAIEAFVPTGGMAYYGLLGFEFLPEAGSSLKIVLSYGDAEQRLYRDIAGLVEEVYLGLPEEFVQGVFEGISEAKDKLSSGVLRCHYSTHGIYGSAFWFFKQLSKICIGLLVLDASASDEDIVASIRGHI